VAETVVAMSYEEFLTNPAVDPHSEWVDGKVVALSPVTDEHALVAFFTAHMLQIWSEWHDLGQVYCEPFQMKPAPDLPGRSPDVLFVTKARAAQVRRLFLDGPADVAVEVLSPDSMTRDRAEKFSEYERGGVREYWLLDPRRHLAEFYALSADDLYAVVQPDAEGIFRSTAVDGLWLPVEWFWSRPSAVIMQRAWGLIP
jgi:Uma2 family endonuclease